MPPTATNDELCAVSYYLHVCVLRTEEYTTGLLHHGYTLLRTCICLTSTSCDAVHFHATSARASALSLDLQKLICRGREDQVFFWLRSHPVIVAIARLDLDSVPNARRKPRTAVMAEPWAILANRRECFVMRLKLRLSCLGRTAAQLTSRTCVHPGPRLFWRRFKVMGPGRSSMVGLLPFFWLPWRLGTRAALAWDTMHDQFGRPEAQFVTGNETTKHIRLALTTPVSTHPH